MLQRLIVFTVVVALTAASLGYAKAQSLDHEKIIGSLNYFFSSSDYNVNNIIGVHTKSDTEATAYFNIYYKGEMKKGLTNLILFDNKGWYIMDIIIQTGNPLESPIWSMVLTPLDPS